MFDIGTHISNIAIVVKESYLTYQVSIFIAVLVVGSSNCQLNSFNFYYQLMLSVMRNFIQLPQMILIENETALGFYAANSPSHCRDEVNSSRKYELLRDGMQFVTFRDCIRRKEKKESRFYVIFPRFAGSMIDCMSTTTHNLKKNASYVFAGVRTKLENMTNCLFISDNFRIGISRALPDQKWGWLLGGVSVY